jgi:hypothetical protein
MGWSAVLPPHQQGKLAKGTQAKEHAMSLKVNSAINVPDSGHWPHLFYHSL